MAAQETFKLGQFTDFQLPSVIEDRTSSRTGNDFIPTNTTPTSDRNKKLEAIVNSTSDGQRVSGDRILPKRRRTNEGSDFGKAFDSSIESLKATGHGAAAAVGTALGFEDFADAEIKASNRNQRKADRLARGLILDLKDVEFDKGIGEGIGDLGSYFINGAGTLAPSILETVAAGVAGAAVGSVAPGAGTVAGGLLGATAKIAGKKKLQSLIKEYVATKGFKEVAKTSARGVALNARKKKIVEDSMSRFYQTVAVAASGQTLGTGEIFNEALESGATKEEASQFGLIGGVPFAALDSILPASIIRDLGGKFIGGRVKNALREAGEGFVKEGATELAQEEILLRTSENFDDDFDIAGEEASSRRLNAFVLGGFGGGVVGGAAGATQRRVESKDLKTPLTNTDFSNKEVRSAFARVQSLSERGNSALNKLGTDVDQDRVNEIINSTSQSIETIKQDITNKFLSEENKDTASRAEAEEVLEVIDTLVSDTSSARAQIQETVDSRVNEPDLERRTNPEFDNIAKISEKVLGTSQGLGEELTKSELEILTQSTQARLKSLEDQEQGAELGLSSLRSTTQEDIRQIVRNRDLQTDTEGLSEQEVASGKKQVEASKKKVRVEKEIEELPSSNNSKPKPTRANTKPTRKTEQVIDVEDEGILDTSNLPKDVIKNFPVDQLKDARVKVVGVSPRKIEVLAESSDGQVHKFKVFRKSFVSQKKIPDLEDTLVSQIEIEDKIKSKNFVDNSSTKPIFAASAKDPNIDISQELETLSDKNKRGKLNNEELLRFNELESQVELDDTPTANIEESDISLEQSMAAATSEVLAKKAELQQTSLTEQDIQTISSINTEIGELQELKSILDQDVDLEERKEIQKRILSLKNEKDSIKGASLEQNVSQKKITEKLPLGNSETIVTEDVDNVLVESRETTSFPEKPTPELATRMNEVISRIKSGLTANNSDIQIHYATSFKEFKEATKRSDINRLRFDSIKAVAIKNPEGSPVIVINGTKNTMQVPETVVATLMHELVGHVGMTRVFGDKFTSFKRALLDSNQLLRNDILKLSTKWKSYRQTWLQLNNNNESGLSDKNSYTFKDPSTNKPVRLHDSVALVLAEEYMSELAAIKMIDRNFKVNSNLREGFISRVVKKLMHFSRSILGKFNSGLNEEDMLSAVAASANFLFKDNVSFKFSDMRQPVLRAELRKRSDGIGLDSFGRLKVDRNLGFGIDKTSTSNKLKQSEKDFIADLENIDLEQFAFDMEEGKSAALAMGADSRITDGVTKALASGYGKLNESARASFANKIGRKIQGNPFLSKFFALGNLPHKELYNATQAVTKGKLGKLEILARKSSRDLKNLSSFQSQRVFSFFKTKFTEEEGSAAIQDLLRQGIPQGVVDTILESKSAIESLGQQYVDLGLLNADTFEENRGSYLPTRYLKYLFTNPGGGKQTSFLNFLKKDKHLDDDTKAALGEIKDPGFLVSETIGMMGRDIGILQMFESLAENGRKGSTGWILNSEDFVQLRGKNRSLDWLEKEIDRVTDILADHDSDNTGAFQLTDDQEAFNRALLAEMTVAGQEAEVRMLDRLKREAKEGGLGEIDATQYRSQHYTKLKKSKRFGALSNLWVRKEIANDLEGVMNSFEIDPNDPISKWFGDSGVLVRGNSYWKTLKVPFNLPSWFRNGAGNLTLLDISSTTPMPKLTGMYIEEIFNAASKKESKYWNWAVDNGLFGTTYAASELYGLQREFAKKLKIGKNNDKLTAGSKMKGMFGFMNEQFLGAADTASQMFGLLEGSFKTVAMRDFIQQWQAQNDVKSIDSLPNDQKQAVILEAVAHANNALFDYSQVAPLVSFARRYPLGAPFITFMYKSFPVVLEAMAKRPQKFIKYAAFPMLMNMMAQSMNDWDDDDVERLRASFPQWTRDKSSVFLFPYKDANENPQFAEYGYALPWSPFMDAGLKVNNHFEANSISSAVSSSVSLGADISDDLGLLGGPLAQVITAWKSNKDSFTGRDIVNPGDSASKQIASRATWAWNMAMPSFITSHGFLGKLYDDLDIDLPGLPTPEPLDRTGKDKITAGQLVGNLTGFQSRGFDPEDSVQSSLKFFALKLREISTARNRFLKDPNIRRNPEERAAGLRDFNTRQKLINQERSDFLKQVRG